MKKGKLLTLFAVFTVIWSTFAPSISEVSAITLNGTTSSLSFVDENHKELNTVSLNQGETKTLLLKADKEYTDSVSVSLPQGVTLDTQATQVLAQASGAGVQYDTITNNLEVNYSGVKPTVNTQTTDYNKFVALVVKGDNTGSFNLQATAVQNGVTTTDTVKMDVSAKTATVDTDSNQATESADDDADAATAASNNDISLLSGDVNVDLDISTNTNTVESGNDASYKLVFKVTGINTTYTNAKITLALPAGYQLSQSLDTLQIAGVTPTFDSTSSTLTYSFDEITAGQTYTVNLKVATTNGTTPDGTKIPVTANFEADNFSGNAKTTAETTVKASSSLSTSKSYVETEDASGKVITDPPTAGMIGTWKIDVRADKKSTGLLYFKEGSKIIVVDTIPDGLTYVSDDAGGVYDAVAKTVTWTFDAPTTAEQEAALSTLFDKGITVKTKFNDDIENFASFKNKVNTTATDISDNSITNDVSASVSTGASDPNELPSGSGTIYPPSHTGPKNGQDNDSAGDATNPNPVVYDSAILKFAVKMTSNYSASLTKDFTKYNVTYNVDPNINLEYIQSPGIQNYAPDAEHNKGGSLVKLPAYDIYATINGTEKKIGSTIAKGQIERIKDYGIPEGTHVSQIRFVFTYAPAGMYLDAFQLGFSVQKGYQGKVENTVAFDVAGFDSSNNANAWTNDTDINDVDKRTGPRTAEVIQQPAASIPVAKSKIAFDTSDNGVVKPGNNRITGSFANDTSSSQTMVKPLQAMVLLPEGVTVDTSNPEYQLTDENGTWDDKTSDGNNINGKVSIGTNDYNGTGRQLVKVEWNASQMRPNQKLSYGFDTIISKTAPTTLTMDTYGFSGTDKVSVPTGASTLTDSYLEVDTDDMNSDTNTSQDRVKSSNQYHILRDSQVQTQKLVKGEKDSDYSNFGHTTLGGNIDYRLKMKNKGDSISNFVMMDVLSSIGDLGITDNADRGSQFTPELTGPVSVPAAWNGKVTIKYSEATNPSRDDLDKDVDYPSTSIPMTDPSGAQNPDWKTENQVTDWSKIHSFIVTLNDGEWVSGGELTLDFTMKAPKTLANNLIDPNVDEQTRAAWNSFAYTVDNSQVVEPPKVGVVVDYIGSAELVKTDSETKKVLAGATFDLQDATGKVLQSNLVTAADGKIAVNNLQPGDYQFVETKAPAGYDLDKTPVKFTIKNDQTEVIKVTKTNKLTPGSVVLTKTDSKTDKTLAGAVFELQDSKGNTLQKTLTTDANGQLKVDDLAPGDYQFVETKAPAGYQIDRTPVKFTIVKEQTEAIQVIKENSPIVPPTIHKDIDGKDSEKIDRNQEFNWNVQVAFGNATSEWETANITDKINDLLDILAVKVTDENGKDVTTNGTLSIKNNKIVFTLNKQNGNFAYLSGHTYTMTVKSKIKDGATNEELEQYMTKGIPNTADFTDDGNTIHSNTPYVIPPVDPTDPTDPTEPSNSNNSADQTVTANSNNDNASYLPQTGEGSATLIALLGLTGIALAAILLTLKKAKRN